METKAELWTAAFDDLFKSYYVVWKLKYIYDKEKKEYEFKSYYVVWKLEKHSLFRPILCCLNRTMQYGNSVLFFYHFQLQIV